MGNEAEVKVDTSSQAKAEAEVSKELVASKSPMRPTSITGAKNPIEQLRPTSGLLEGEHIHIVHIICFIILIYFLFAGMWKLGKKTKF